MVLNWGMRNPGVRGVFAAKADILAEYALFAVGKEEECT